MNDPLSRCHPLHITGGNRAAIPHAIAVINGSGEDVSDCFNPPMGVPWKPSQIIFRYIVPEIVQEEEGSKSEVFPKPKARRKCTPAPSSVGFDLLSFLTGLRDIKPPPQILQRGPVL